MKPLYSALALSMLAFTACVDDESYDDWSAPQQNNNISEEQLSGVTFAASAVEAIDFANLTETDTVVTIFNPSLNVVEGVDSVETTTYKVILGNSAEEIDVLAGGKIPTETLKAAVESAFGKAPVQRDLAATIVAYTKFTLGSVSRTTSDIVIKATLTAPEIEEAYYYIGQVNGWSTTDQTYKFTRADESVNVYDDPIFTCIVPAYFVEDEETGEMIRAEQYFKIAPASAYKLEDFWSGKLLGSATDGDESLEVNLINEGAQALKRPATDEALSYKITLNMMEFTLTIEPISYTEWLYVPGNGQGWSPDTAPALHSPASDGKYTGYAIIDGEFKFTKERNWNDGEYNADSFATYSEGFENSNPGTGGNIKCTAAAGIYWLDINVADGVFNGTLIEQFSIIGGVLDAAWSIDADMTYDAETNTYSWTGDLAAGEFKFRAIHGWDINLGGYLDELGQNGANLVIAEAGNYTIVLNPLITTVGGSMTATVTKN
ncbi:MAG: SusF/SusE family outer membrane protein [Bacteroidales bacterium]|nr:SusF/SusE family outer membrane protein [Bacteroidales bacterium]